MLVKFETSSNRVKGISFHPTRYWILSSLHNGAIQLWDYNAKTLIDSYEEHEGPVRGVCFHKSQPLFASGGDDNKVKIWNFKQKKCLFTLEGHLDYIRTVAFHHELAWLMSSSDDQTIRIWNWQNRTCIAILTGHNHYIMSASFHPSEDMIISASLDQTVRVWDFKSLRQKFYAANKSADVMLGTDVVVKFVLEGHDRGVNWASFQYSSQYIVTAADDRTVRLWRYTDTKAWEVEVMRGHSNNVSSAIFHPNLDVIVSNSEDKSLRIWDVTRRTCIYTHKKDDDRFWVLSSHPSLNIIAAGTDSGMVIFKLEKERVPATVHKGYVYVARAKQLKRVDDADRESVIAAIKTPCKKDAYLNNPAYILVNGYGISETNILLQYEQDGGSYMLFSYPKDWKGEVSPTVASGQSCDCCFVSKDRFAVLAKNKEVLIMDFSNSVKKKVSVEIQGKKLFPAGLNKILVSDNQELILIDIGLKETLKSVKLENAKYAVWSPNNEYIALLSNTEATICNKDLEIISQGAKERDKIKSAIWDPCGVVLFSTTTHIKYLLINNDNGIVCSVEFPQYLISLNYKNNRKTILSVDRSGKLIKTEITSIEYRFKLALHTKRFNEVKEILENGGLTGNAIVKYLQDRGFPEIALYFVEDEKTRFNLAIQAGIIETALQSAIKLNDKECWVKVGNEALKQGNSQIVEMAYQKTRNLDRLSVLYLMTGNLTKLAKMQQISESRNDKMRLMHNTLLRGDVEKRIELLAETGQVPLAYITARVHNMTHMLNGPLEESLGPQTVEKLEDYISKLPQTSCLQPPCPVISESSTKDQNWPLKNLITSEYELRKNQVDPINPYSMNQVSVQETHNFAEEPIEAANWGDKLDFELEEVPESEGAWGNTDFDIPEVPETQEKTSTTGKNVSPGLTQQQKWARTCTIPGELVSAGAFSQAMQTMTRLAGITNFLPLKPLFLQVHMSGQISIPLIPSINPLTHFLTTNTNKPIVPINLTSLSHKLKDAYKLVTQAKFSEALSSFSNIIHSILFIVASNESEENEAKELIKICVEYISCMRLEISRQEAAKSNPAKALVLGYFMSMCKLQPSHQSLTVRSAITYAYKYKNFITCTTLCKRFLELIATNPQVLGTDAKQVIDKHKKLLAYCQQVFTNDLALECELPETSADIAGILCQKTFSVVLPSMPSTRCPYCGSLYHKVHKGGVCETCNVAQIGLEALGLKLI